MIPSLRSITFVLATAAEKQHGISTISEGLDRNKLRRTSFLTGPSHEPHKPLYRVQRGSVSHRFELTHLHLSGFDYLAVFVV